MTPGSGNDRSSTRKPPAVMTVTVLVAIAFGLLIAFAPGILVVVVGGMLTALAALLTDRSRYRLTALTVAAMNLAGCLPFIMQIAARGSDLAAAGIVLGAPWPWGVMYVAAAAGWALLWLGPLIARMAVAALIDIERRRLEKIQSDLVAQWGRGITEG